MTKFYVDTTFNISLTGQQISEMQFYRQYWKQQNMQYFDPNNSEYDQELVDDFINFQNLVTTIETTYQKEVLQ